VSTNRDPGRRLRLSAYLALLCAVPGWAGTATATPEAEAHRSRFAVSNSALEREGESSVSGRYRLEGEAGINDRAAVQSAPGRRYGGSAKLVTVADCSHYVFADGFEP
jgi:hypothetical protein